MKGSEFKISPDTIKKLMVIGEKQGTISLKDLSLEMGLSGEDTLIFLRQIFPGGIGAEVYNRNNECMVDIDAHAIQYMLPLSPAEWIGLHQLLINQQNPALKSLEKKITENGPIKAVMELLSQLDHWDLQLSEPHQAFVSKLDEAVSQKAMVSITTTVGKSYQMFPCKIIHLEGKLSMIAEDANDHCLIVLSISDLKEVAIVEGTSHPKVADFEIEEFIFAIRSMNEQETRLILKINDPQSVNLFPDHHFLGKPCMITNSNGDLIWAAYVEPCEDLFEWLLILGSNVEVLDPGKFKDEFLMYCEEKIRKVA
jgi:predicted DNA-binding transcriptional regulator YafY